MHDKVRSHRQLAELATRQHGVVSTGQLERLEYSRDTAARMAKAGRLHRLHRGVYAVGHTRLSAHGRCLAAVLACGSDALLSHFAASWLWGLWREAPERIDVTVAVRGHSRGSLCLHHAPALGQQDRTVRDGIPVTALPRTLLDLGQVAPRRLPRSIELAEQLGLFDLREVDRMLKRCGRHRGRRELAAAIAAYRDPGFTRSELERRFLRLVREAGLPQPSVNTFVAGYEIDVYWEVERFGVELDTYDFHGGRVAFERDRLRQEDLKLAGIEIVRITGRRLDLESRAVINRVARLLERRRGELGVQ